MEDRAVAHETLIVLRFALFLSPSDPSHLTSQFPPFFLRPTTNLAAAVAAAASSSPSDPSSSSSSPTDPPRSSARARAIAPPAIGRSSVDVGVALSDLPASSSSPLADSPAPPSTPLRCPNSFVAPLPAPGFDPVPSALLAIARGEFVVVLDDADRENEGDLILAADAATTAKVAFMVEETSGVLCVGLPAPACDRLALPLMVPPARNEDAMRTAFTVTVDATEGISTGISAADRARTIRLLAGGTESGDVVDAQGEGEGEASTSSSPPPFTSTTLPSDLRRPGHIFPLRSHPGGVRSRPGHTEAAVDLSRLAGRRPAGLLCEIVDRTASDGSMARTPRLLAFSKEAGLKCITIADLVAFMDARDAAIEAEKKR